MRGEFLSQRWERNQRIAGGDSHRRRKQVPSGSSSFSPSPPFTGDTPIPFRKISGAQNMVPGLIPSGPLGPSTAQNFGLCYFTAAPGSDQPWQGVRNRRRVDRNCSEHRKRAGRWACAAIRPRIRLQAREVQEQEHDTQQ